MAQEAQRAPRSFTQSHAWIQRSTGAKAGHRRVPGAREELVERALRFIRPLKDIFTPIWLGPSIGDFVVRYSGLDVGKTNLWGEICAAVLIDPKLPSIVKSLSRRKPSTSCEVM